MGGPQGRFSVARRKGYPVSMPLFRCLAVTPLSRECKLGVRENALSHWGVDAGNCLAPCMANLMLMAQNASILQRRRPERC